jgi:hypothetical protein
MNAFPPRIFLPLLLSWIVVATAGCAKTGSTAGAPATTANATSAAPPGNACDRNLITKDDVAGLFSEPIAKVEALKGDPQSCVFTTTGFSSVTVSVRPDLGELTVDAWLTGKMNVAASPVSGIGDKAAWTPVLKELNASHKNLLCDIGASGPATGGATQEKITALCAKIFAAS